MLIRIKKPLRQFIYRGWETNHDIKNTVLLAGCARSGTTWIAETIDVDHSYRVIFEPFNSVKTPEWNEYSFIQYLRRNSEDAKALKTARKILSGKIHSEWIDHQNKTILAKRRLVKDIRVNLMLGWLRERFPDMPIVLLIRHPLSVTASKMRLGWTPILSLDRIVQQPHLIEDFLQPFMPEIEKYAADDFAMHLVSWCIEYYVPIRQLRPEEYCEIRHENLIFGAKPEISKLFDYLDIPLTNIHFEQLKKPSATTRGSEYDPHHPRLLQPWAGKFSTEQLAKAQKIFDLFEVKTWLPNYPLL